MLLLLHALIPCLGAYNILPSSSVLLHINIVSHSLYCCIYIHYTCFSTFWHCHPSFNILMEMFLLPCFTVFFCCIETVVCHIMCLYIKPYNSTVQEFCAVQFAAHLCCSSFFESLGTTMLQAQIRAQNKNGVQQRGSLWAWL